MASLNTGKGLHAGSQWIVLRLRILADGSHRGFSRKLVAVLRGRPQPVRIQVFRSTIRTDTEHRQLSGRQITDSSKLARRACVSLLDFGGA